MYFTSTLDLRDDPGLIRNKGIKRGKDFLQFGRFVNSLVILFMGTWEMNLSHYKTKKPKDKEKERETRERERDIYIGVHNVCIV